MNKKLATLISRAVRYVLREERFESRNEAIAVLPALVEVCFAAEPAEKKSDVASQGMTTL